jgi:rhodanese-related sulfurtransferase
MGEFLMNNLALVGLFVASGAMLFWPEIMKIAGASSQEVGTLEATRLMNDGKALVLDVRDAKEFAAGHLPRARHIPLPELSKRLDELAKWKSKPVLVTGKGGASGSAAARFLKRAGFENVVLLRGGIASWQQASLPLEK